MLALAIVLLVLVVLLVVVAYVGSSDEIVIEFLNVTITSSVGGVFVSGVVAGLVALASFVALMRSVRRIRQRSKEVSELRRKADAAAPAPIAEAASTGGTSELAGTPDAETSLDDVDRRANDGETAWGEPAEGNPAASAAPDADNDANADPPRS